MLRQVMLNALNCCGASLLVAPDGLSQLRAADQIPATVGFEARQPEVIPSFSRRCSLR